MLKLGTPALAPSLEATLANYARREIQRAIQNAELAPLQNVLYIAFNRPDAWFAHPDNLHGRWAELMAYLFLLEDVTDSVRVARFMSVIECLEISLHPQNEAVSRALATLATELLLTGDCDGRLLQNLNRTLGLLAVGYYEELEQRLARQQDVDVYIISMGQQSAALGAGTLCLGALATAKEPLSMDQLAACNTVGLRLGVLSELINFLEQPPTATLPPFLSLYCASQAQPDTMTARRFAANLAIEWRQRIYEALPLCPPSVQICLNSVCL
jgi:hypothetical protein